MAFVFSACSSKKKSSKAVRVQFADRGRSVPSFSADSAYKYVDKQVSFGPRTVNSKAHDEDRAYLLKKLEGYAGKNAVYSQDFQLTGYNNVQLNLSNVIAAFNPNAKDRIMLCTHWDTRPYSDQDPDSALYYYKPIPGADDGGSGVGVLLELASIFKNHPPPIGVDLIFFDGEDYGKDDQLNYYFLGSRYWAQHQPVQNYNPRFGILLDMVGGKNAIFPKEGMSMRYDPELVNEIWNMADNMGYGNVFTDQQTSGVSDDHLVMDQILSFPTIDIINHHQENSNEVGFPVYWHTHNDNMKIISKQTLQTIGNVLTEMIYNRL